MTLVMEIEFLSGVCFATTEPDSAVADWPPQPDRIFSALVATWAAHGKRDEETEALKWLESLRPPLLDASNAAPRTAYISFVPPNDATSSKKKHAVDVIPAMRTRQPRQFVGTRPERPVVRLFWKDADPDGIRQHADALNALAADTSYVGHSSSLTRCHVYCTDDEVPEGVQEPKRRIYPGRLDELVRTFEAGRRPHAGEWVVENATSGKQPSHSIFSTQWLLLEHVGGDMPDIRATAIVAKAIRDTLVAGYQGLGAGVNVPEVVSGRTSDGDPVNAPHLAIVPLAFTGFPYADGHLLGFGIVPPRGSDLLNDTDWLRALRAITTWDRETSRHLIRLRMSAGDDSALEMVLSPSVEPSKRSLDPSLYTHYKGEPARTFATVTPIVLDRHVKVKGAARVNEIVTQIVDACRRIGLPEPDVLTTRDGVMPAVVPDKHSALEGAPSAGPSGHAPSWMRWRLPSYLAGRLLTHAVIRFSEPVEGPVILGAGRFLGLGLCRPIAEGGDVV
ncbi:MAG: type I-U CRISPR-associated protein Cas5/Cas6 [Alicyclobacillus sp.]|nr:type I-U CRISPR-associated protein Cas5/Cas6 [Alicyclobacillus sp.]